MSLQDQVNVEQGVTKGVTYPNYSRWAYLKFIICSIIGAMLFLVPIAPEGSITILVGVLADYSKTLLIDYLPSFMTIIFALSVLLSFYVKAAKPAWLNKVPELREILDVNKYWLGLRIVGLIFAVMTLFKVGPEFIIADFTGGLMLNDLVTVLATWFLFVGFFLPFLTNFGIMEFAGTLFTRVMRPLFTVPGRSSIDCFASWIGSGTAGALITVKQYEDGFYTKREAAIIATNFSVVSVAFALVVIKFINLEHMFLQVYISVIVSGFIAAIILPRIPPLSRKEDTFNEAVGKRINEEIPAGESLLKWGFFKGVERANQVKSAGQVIRSGVFTVVDMWFGLVPLVMAIGTIALIVAEFTSFFNILATPLVPILELLQIPEAKAAAPAMIIGFADMFLPAVIGRGIESELTRFVISGVAVTQLIFMSEVGVLLLKSKIPLSFLDLVVIFILRTIITLPIITAMAYLFFF
jgi:nucleoside recognition membrane protein YjiH